MQNSNESTGQVFDLESVADFVKIAPGRAARALMRRHPDAGTIRLRSLTLEKDGVEAVADPNKPGRRTGLRAFVEAVRDHVVGFKNRLSGQQTLSAQEADLLRMLAYRQLGSAGTVAFSGIFAEHAEQVPWNYTLESDPQDATLQTVSSVTIPAQVLFFLMTVNMKPSESKKLYELYYDKYVQAMDAARFEGARDPKGVLSQVLDEGDGQAIQAQIEALRAMAQNPQATVDEINQAPDGPDAARTRKGIDLLTRSAAPTMVPIVGPAYGQRGEVACPGVVVIGNDPDAGRMRRLQSSLPASVESRLENYGLGLHAGGGTVLYAVDASAALAECIGRNDPFDLLDATAQASTALRRAFGIPSGPPAPDLSRSEANQPSADVSGYVTVGSAQTSERTQGQTL